MRDVKGVDFHARVLAAVDRLDPHGVLKAPGALRDVVVLHTPEKPEGETITRCRACREPVGDEFPCETIAVVAERLDVRSQPGGTP